MNVSPKRQSIIWPLSADIGSSKWTFLTDKWTEGRRKVKDNKIVACFIRYLIYKSTSVCFLPVMIEMSIFGTCSITSRPVQIYLVKDQLNPCCFGKTQSHFIPWYFSKWIRYIQTCFRWMFCFWLHFGLWFWLYWLSRR